MLDKSISSDAFSASFPYPSKHNSSDLRICFLRSVEAFNISNPLKTLRAYISF